MFQQQLFLSIALLLSTTHAFLGGYNPQVHPALADLSTSTDQVLKLRFDLGLTNNDPYQRTALPRLALNGPTMVLKEEEEEEEEELKLSSVSVSSPSESVLMPGQEKAYQKVTAGQKPLEILEKASFIGLNGLETVPLEQGSWEMMWIQDSFSGRLICGFHLPVPIHRNGITFEPGTMYLSFNVYSPETLAAAQSFKFLTQQKSIHLLNEKEEELSKMKKTSNPLAKAVHYQRAFAAFDKLVALPPFSHIPEENEVIQLKNGLFVVKEGIVWKKLNAMFGPSSQSLGKVVISLVDNENDDNNNDNNNKLRP